MAISDFAITVWYLNNVFGNYQHIIASSSFEWLHTLQSSPSDNMISRNIKQKQTNMYML